MARGSRRSASNIVSDRQSSALESYIRCAYNYRVSFEWDEEKRRLNLRKHRVEFADAVSAFEDPDAITLPDDDDDDENRFVTVALDLFGRVLVVVYTWRGDTIRVISARKATARERKQYGE